MSFIFAYHQDPWLFLPCRKSYTKLNNIDDYTFIVTMETTVDDLLSILFPDSKQYIVLVQVPRRIGFVLIYRPTLALFISWFVQLFDNGVGSLKHESQAYGHQQMFKMFLKSVSKCLDDIIYAIAE